MPVSSRAAVIGILHLSEDEATISPLRLWIIVCNGPSLIGLRFVSEGSQESFDHIYYANAYAIAAMTVLKAAYSTFYRNIENSMEISSITILVMCYNCTRI